LWDDEEETEQFEGVRKNNTCEHQKEMQQPRLTASVRDALSRDHTQPVLDKTAYSS
jgi:hypothetical protein